MNIAIASGKGGTGKTTIATNLSLARAEKGERVTLADCDVEEPELPYFSEAPYCLLGSGHGPKT